MAKFAICNIFVVAFQYNYFGFRKFENSQIMNRGKGTQQFKVSIDFYSICELVLDKCVFGCAASHYGNIRLIRVSFIG